MSVDPAIDPKLAAARLEMRGRPRTNSSFFGVFDSGIYLCFIVATRC